MQRFGLRTRILLALLATSAVTLIVAALALFSPLQDRLESQRRDAVESAALAVRPTLEEALMSAKGVAFYGPPNEILSTLSLRTDARVALFNAIPDAQPLVNIGITDLNLADVFRSMASNEVVTGVTRDGAGVAIPISLARFRKDQLKGIPIGDQYFTLVIRKPDLEGEAVDTVREAFITAALVGLAVAVVLGLALSAGLSRRLHRLRRTALRLARDGPDAPPPPPDDGADEVGDLARALRSMQTALKRQEDARRAFVATASHELRTPLTSVQGNLELLAEDLEHGTIDRDFARQQLAVAQEQLQRIANLASELLDLSRLDAGVELRREPVELGELCRAVAAEFELRAHGRAVDIAVRPPRGPVWAAGDPGAVARVVRILLDNALRFAPAGEPVVVHAAYDGERATLEVADRGPGVPEAERIIIFDRFQRGSRTGGSGGFGLGLAIGRELARRLGGELALAPTPDGVGARFVLTLPIELPRGSGLEDALELTPKG